MRIFSFSGGRTSAYMTLKYWKQGDLVLFANTGREHDLTLDFVRNFELYEGIPIVWLEYTKTNKYLKKKSVAELLYTSKVVNFICYDDSADTECSCTID